MHKRYPQQAFHGSMNEQSFGDYINNNEKAYVCFDLTDSRDCKYIYSGKEDEDCQDCCYTVRSIRSLNCLSSVEAHNNICSAFSWNASNTLYSFSCYNSSNLFGCYGLRNKQYCIFNKQYSKKEYEKLVPQIIEYMIETGEWGEFFSPSLSPFGYNETVAQEYFPLTKEEA